MELKREQVNALIEQGKKRGFSGKEIIDGLVRKGYQPEGVDVNAIKATFPQAKPIEEKPSMFERIKTGIQEKGAKVQEQIQGEGEFANKTALERGVGATATAFSGISGTLYNALPEGARNTLDKIGGGIGQGINYLADKISNNPALQEFAMSEAGKDTERVSRVLADLGIISGEILGADQATKVPVEQGLTKTGETLTTGTEKTITGAQKLLPKSPEIMNRVARLNPSDAKKFAKLSGGKTQGEYLTETGNFGAPDKIIKNEATKFAETLASKDAELAKLPGLYKDSSIIEATKELLKKAKSESSGSVKAPYLDEATRLQTKALAQGLSHKEINILKRLFEKNVKLGYNKLTADSSIIKKATNIDSALREFQDNIAKSVGFENLPELNKQIQLSKFLVDKLGDEVVGKNGLNNIGLTDWIVLSGGDPTAVGAFLTKRFFSSKGVQSKVAELMNTAEIKPTPTPKVKLTPEGIERGVSPTGAKQLLAPKPGAIRVKLESGKTINQPSRKAIEQGTEIVPRITPSKQTTQPLLKKSVRKASPKSSPKSTTKSSLKGQGVIPETNYKQYSPELRNRVEKDLLADTKKAVVIDTDTIKKLHPEYNPKNPMALHKESSALSKEIYEKAVKQDKSGVVKFIGGGAGSGKSEVILTKILDKPAVVFDGTLANFDSAIKKIDYAISQGKKVEIYPVYTPIELATLFNKMRLRNVSDGVLLDTHFGMRNTIPELIKKYGNKIKVTPYENKVFDPTRKYMGEKSKLSVIEQMKATREELARANSDINGLVEDYGMDIAKKVINDIIKM